MTHDSNDSARDTIPYDLPPYEDAELDAAMRELEAIERGEAGYPSFTRYSLAAAFWRVFGVGAAALGILLASPSAHADETKKPKRPVMCMQGKVISGDGFAGYVCLDGKRPRIFTRYIEVKFVDENGAARTYVLGWSAPIKRTATGGYVAEGTIKL